MIRQLMSKTNHVSLVEFLKSYRKILKTEAQETSMSSFRPSAFLSYCSRDPLLSAQWADLLGYPRATISLIWKNYIGTWM